MADFNVGGISIAFELGQFVIEQWLKHKRENEGLTTEQALEKAAENYEAAKAENQGLKDLGHE